MKYTGDRYYELTEKDVYKAIDTLNKRIKTYSNRNAIAGVTENFDKFKTKSQLISKSKKTIAEVMDNIVLLRELGLIKGSQMVLNTMKQEQKITEKFAKKYSIKIDNVAEETYKRLYVRNFTSRLSFKYEENDDDYREELEKVAPELFRNNRKVNKLTYGELYDIVKKLEGNDLL